MLTVSLAGNGSGTVSGTGISCPGTCSHSYTAGSTVTLTASAASASTFSGWSGGCSGTGSCTVTLSSDQVVTATFTAAGAVVPTPSSYSGFTSQVISGDGVLLYVSPDSTHVQDVTIGAVALACAPSTPPNTNPSPDRKFEIASIPINADGSFSTTTTETAVIGNEPVHITYTFSGHFHGRNSADSERIAGAVREDLTYDKISTTCSSNTQYWSATFESQGNQAPLAPPAGSYSGFTSQVISGDGVLLAVSPDSTHLQNVTIGAVALACTPATPNVNPSPDLHFNIASIPIDAGGSFSGTVTQAGVQGGAPVHFTYTFSGHFHGQNTSNKERVAGTFREDLTYDGTSTTCTSNSQSWFATQQ
jgi:Divergent InlB B-repeat domain